MKTDIVINLELNIDILNFGTTVGKSMMFPENFDKQV